jgi:nucleoside-diphosphate-sugar epimerase
MLGSLDVPHSVTYMPDVAATIAAVITTPTAAGRSWLVPNSAAITQRQVIVALARAAGTEAKVSTVPRIAITLGGLVVPLFRELQETWYQFAEPWTTDSSVTEAELGLKATPLADGAAATVDWWRAQVSRS